MGTRADYYIKSKNNKLKWIGSTGWDGYPEGMELSLLRSNSLEVFQSEFKKHIETRDDFTSPKDGWPWPWDDSRTTDYAYIFDVNEGKVSVSCFNSGLFDPLKYRKCKDNGKYKLINNAINKIIFPNMKVKRNAISLDSKKSGLIVIGG